MTVASTTTAAPVQYVRICSLYGANFFYIPGTDTCLDPTTGDIRTATERGVVRGVTPLANRVGNLESDVSDIKSQIAALQSAEQAEAAIQARFDSEFRDYADGSAISMALADPDLSGSEHFGIKANWGTYLGSNAFGLTFAGVLAEHAGNRLTLSGGVAYTGRNIGGRAGVQFSW